MVGAADSHPQRGRCPAPGGAAPQLPSCLWLGGAARPHWLRQLSVSGAARRYLLERGGTVARTPALIGSWSCRSDRVSLGPAPPLFVPGGQWWCWARPWPHSQHAPGQALAKVPVCSWRTMDGPPAGARGAGPSWVHAEHGAHQPGTPHRP